ncbi:MAG: hypothetical protein CW691_11690 [Candidatus Bathyarchaeum sp.]|nr:MAG: hypothetical protein CW691_11690 [Candidatus Bathyarchaeum sp.]
MNLKNRLEHFVRGWIPKEPSIPRGTPKMVETKSSRPKPWWWKPYWILLVILTIVFSLVPSFFTQVTIERAIFGLLATLLCMGFAYYIRVRPSMRINRALFILLGITPIGFVLWVICVFILNRTLLLGASGTWPFAVLCAAVCFGLGALIGDWIGKKRNYILPMMP